MTRDAFKERRSMPCRWDRNGADWRDGWRRSVQRAPSCDGINRDVTSVVKSWRLREHRKRSAASRSKVSIYFFGGGCPGGWPSVPKISSPDGWHDLGDSVKDAVPLTRLGIVGGGYSIRYLNHPNHRLKRKDSVKGVTRSKVSWEFARNQLTRLMCVKLRFWKKGNTATKESKSPRRS